MAGESFKILLLPGDGIGPEVVGECRAILDTVADTSGARFTFETALIGGAAIDAYGEPLRDQDIDLARSCDAVLLGAVGGLKWNDLPKEKRPEAGLLRLRKELDLFANLRPVKVFDALVDSSPLKPDIIRGADLLVLRELTGGLYFGQPSKRWSDQNGRQAIDTLPYSEREVERIVELAFQLAKQRKGKVTSVDKANVLNTSQLWREVATEVAERHPDVTFEHALVDSCAMRVIASPASFDVLVMENLFGDVLSDEVAVLSGSLGMLPSASLNTSGDMSSDRDARRFGMYEPVHGSAPDIAGQGKANPVGAILSTAMMLRLSLGLGEVADRLEASVASVLNDGLRTADLVAPGAPFVSTSEMGKAIESRLTSTLSGKA